MSNNIPIMLRRNLDVFAENNPTRRRALIDEFYTEHCVFYDPNDGVHRRRAEIDRMAGVIQATHPDFQYQPIAEPMCRVMVVESNGYPACQVSLLRTLEQTSSLLGRVE
jgi:hypothetical protein